MNRNECDDCILDGTDACTGRVDGHICPDFLRECLNCPEYDTIHHNCPLYCKFIRDSMKEELDTWISELRDKVEDISERTYLTTRDGCTTGYSVKDAYQLKEEVLAIFDKTLSELKGEQKWQRQ